MKGKILIVEDEEKIARALADYLMKSEFETHRLVDGAEVVPWVRKNLPDLILLDVKLPSCDGFYICGAIRSFSAIPIIMLTARIEENDRLLGLELGADDYICKPFSGSEVVARVKAVLRRSGGQSATATNELVTDEQHFQATLLGQKLDLTPIEFKLLHILSTHPGRVYSRSQLVDMIFLDKYTISDRNIDNHIKNLRKKLVAVVPARIFIHSIYGIGYKFESTREMPILPQK